MPRLPYTNFHDLNLNWFLKEFKKIIASVAGKQDAPAQPGTPGQVLGLDANQTPVWMNQSGGVTSYDELTGKPSINGVALSGERTGTDYGLIDAPSVLGTAGQVLGLDESLTPKWIDQEGGSFDITGIASGPIASFDDGANNEPLQDLQIAIEPVQAGTGDPSPSNIRPISGWAGCNVSVAPTASPDDPDKIIYPIIFPAGAGTVYGGMFNPITGQLLVNMVSLDMGSLIWSYNTTIMRFVTTNLSSIIKTPLSNSVLGNILCSCYKNEIANNSTDPTKNNVIMLASSGNLFIRDSSYTSSADLKNALVGKQLVYELTNPITYTLTPTEIHTLLGNNNIWANTGNILQCVYKVDPDIYIQNVAKVKILTPTENALDLKPWPTTYNFGERTTLSLSVTPDTYYKFGFKCPAGSTTTLNISGVTDYTGAVPEAGKTYWVDVWAGIANFTEVVYAMG